MRLRCATIIIGTLICVKTTFAQEWMKIHRNYDGLEWSVPLQIDKYTEYDFSNSQSKLNAYAILENRSEMIVPYSVEYIDSISFAYELTDDEKGHNKYRPFTMHITTEELENIVERELWLNCHISIDGKGEYSDYSGTGRIRGRGNSSWLWYDKKPYKFKLDKKSKLLGLDKAKNWNLLANYRDVTDLMNTLAFETARYMGMPNTNHTRYVEVFLNDEYIGVYQLTEKIEVGTNRVDIDEEDGIMISFDEDDGPNLSPYDGDNFWSSVYSLPICVKHPDDADAVTLNRIKEDFAILENAVKSHDYNKVYELMDIPSFISILQLHEYLYNVEIDAPRSLYAYKDKDGKYTFGPVWDWDAGFDFDWGEMTTGHTFFKNYRELIYGTDPVKRTGASYNINKFWRDMFNDSTFVRQYKDAWFAISDSIYEKCWTETYKYAESLFDEGAYSRDINRWPLTSAWSGTRFYPANEIAKMSEWLKNRKDYIDNVIAGYPNGTEGSVDPSDINVVGTIEKTQSCSFKGGYHQYGSININHNDVTEYLGGEAVSLVPLNADGSEGENTAAKTYGAWFNDEGTCKWGYGHVYIESDNMYTWSYGCHPDNCSVDDTHTVTMQYRRDKKAVNVVVTFNVQ